MPKHFYILIVWDGSNWPDVDINAMITNPTRIKQPD